MPNSLTLVFLLCVTLCISWCFQFSSVADSDIQKYFTEQQTGWIGADIATSIPLDNGVSVFLWGDTLVGKMVNNQRDFNAMPRNSLATVKVTNGEASLPNYYIKRDPANSNSGFFTPPMKTDWFWPTAGIAIAGKLYIIAYDTFQNSSGNFGFATRWTTVITVQNPQDDPNDWKYTQTPLSDTDNILSWSIGAFTKYPLDNYLYLLGSHNNKTDNSAVLSRISLSNLIQNNWSQLEFWAFESASSTQPSYIVGNHYWKLAPLFSPSIPETSMQYHPFLKQYFVLDIRFLDNKVSLRVANQPEGPWSQPTDIYTIPPPWTGTGVFCYAPKSHPEFAKSNEIVFSFMSNTFDINDLKTKTSVYIPQFIRVTISP